ncbi:MAG: DNA polymerase III subunit alpha [Patescibacteria group bacterium]
MSFVNLHGHSHYSLLDGFGSPKEIVKRVKELGYPAAALTDHGVMYGLIELYKESKAAGIKPILGCELYVANRTRFDKEAKVDVKPYHLTALAETFEGYQNLLKLTSKAHLEGFYYKPRVDYGLLKTYSKGLIFLSGCLAAHLPRTILNGDEAEIRRVLEMQIEIFGKNNFYLEMQDHPLIESQGVVNEYLKKLAKEYDMKLVVTCDSHYPRPEDSEVHGIMLCIQTQTNINDPNRMRYTGDFSIRDVKDLQIAFADCPEALTNTLEIAERCNVEFEFGKNLIPKFDTPQNEPADTYLRTLAFEGLQKRFGESPVPLNYNERLEFELKTVHDMGFDTYFLIVHDFVNYAKEKGVVVGPGRGSAAGSILSWVLRITDLDPILHGLFFERFLNPERVSMPDIDIDFADNRRDEILQYVIQKYGRENVAQIITFGTMAPRAAVRDVGRALGYPYQEVDVLAKIVPPPVLGKHIPLKTSIVESPDLKHAYNTDQRAKLLLDYAMKMEGSVRHSGTHACAVVISEKNLNEYTALQYGTRGEREIVTQYSMKPIEELGLLKMDFLGLKNLTVIEQTQKIVEQTRGIKIDIEKLSLELEDAETFKLLQRAETTGVFQLESAGMRRYLKELKPTSFNDIVAMGALYRPGPMEWIPDYIKGKHNPDSVKYLDKSFKSILAPTYGVAVYQEQILQIARDFAGFSLGQADMLRKAVGKKIPALLAEQREKFVEGAVANGHAEKFAREVFEKVVEPFAGYGFNKAHAVCYGLIAYQTAYLKAHYQVEFMTALLCGDAGNTDRVVLEIKECNEMGIAVLPVSINKSFANFTPEGEKAIRFGLMAIKGVGEASIEQIVKIRESGGPFKTLEDITRRVPAQILNKKLIQAMAYSGALDEFGNRKQIAENYDEISKFAKAAQDNILIGQTDIFGLLSDNDADVGNLKLRPVARISTLQELKMEKDYLGLYVSGHPFAGLKDYLSKKGHMIGNLTKKHIGKPVKLIGLISGMKKFITKTGGHIVIFVVEDMTGKLNAVVFPKVLAQCGELSEDLIYSFTGKLEYRRNQYQLICDSAKTISLETMIQNAKEQGLFDKNNHFLGAVRFLDDILGEDEVEEELLVGNSGSADHSHEEKHENLPFLITIPDNFGTEKMLALNETLKSCKGDTPVEIFLTSSNKRIKLQFGVNLNAEFKAKVELLMN